MVNDKFRVMVRPWKKDESGFGQYEMSDYFRNFYNYCEDKAYESSWLTAEIVANYELKPLGGRLIKTSTQGWYLRWDNEASHTMFVLKWS